MDKTVVIYKSKHGSTKKYAEWIGEELECPVLSADDFSKKELEDYENIIFGGCVQAGGIMGFDLIKKNMRRLAGKKLGEVQVLTAGAVKEAGFLDYFKRVLAGFAV